MLSAGNLAPYVGFTEEEAQKSGGRAVIRTSYEVKRWYDGHSIERPSCVA
ncbi:MAG: hypothetical protein ACLR6I_14510 [Waltera sp.]